MLVILDYLLETFEGLEVSLATGQRGIGSELHLLWMLHLAVRNYRSQSRMLKGKRRATTPTIT